MEIQGFSDYLIYPDGRVFSKKGKGKFLKDYNSGEGYRQIRLCNGIDDRKKTSIHRLVAIHYIPNPDNLPEVDHINRIRQDNRVENLRWATRSQQGLNTSLRKDNKLGHRNIIHRKDGYFIYNKKINDIKICKSFKSLEKALCYKFIVILKFKSKYII